MRGFRRMPPHKPFGFVWGYALFMSSSPAWTPASRPGRAARQTDLDKTIGIYQESEKVLSEDLPVIPLWHTNVAAACVKGVHVDYNYMVVPEYYCHQII